MKRRPIKRRARSAGPAHPTAPLPAEAFRSMVAADPNLRTVTLDDVAKVYGVGKRSLLRYVADGQLKATRFGRKYVVTLSALRAFLASNRTTQVSPVGRRTRRTR